MTVNLSGMPRPSPTEIEHIIKRILAADLAVDSERLQAIEAHTPLLGRGVGLDSVETVGLALGLEREFEIEIPDGDLTVETFESLGELVEYVSRKLGEQPGPGADGGDYR